MTAMWINTTPVWINMTAMWINMTAMWINMTALWINMTAMWINTTALWINMTPVWINMTPMWINMTPVWINMTAMWINMTAMWINISRRSRLPAQKTDALHAAPDKGCGRWGVIPHTSRPGVISHTPPPTAVGRAALQALRPEFTGALKTKRRMKVFSTVKLGLTGISSKALVEKGRNCVDMLTGNPAYTLPANTLTDLTAACNKLEQANEEVLFYGGIVNHQAKRTAFGELADLLRELAGLVQAQSNGEETKILSAGFEVRRKGSPVDKLGTPENLRPMLTNFSRQVDLRWNRVDNAVNYQVYANSVDPAQEDKWELVAYTSRTAYTVEALESAKFYWFRVQALGRKGLISPLSQTIKALAA